MKKLDKVFFSILFLIFCFHLNVIVLAQAVFPDRLKLQPMPADVQPNISGSINSNPEIRNETINNSKNTSVLNADYSNSEDLDKNNPKGGDLVSKDIITTDKYIKLKIFVWISVVFIVIFLFIIRRRKD
jgi:hypothetical protein